MRIRLSLAALAAALAVVCPAQATVTSAYAPSTYSCNGVTTVYTIGFKYLAQGDLLATSTTAAGVVTTLVLTTDYTVSPTLGGATGTLTLVAGARCPSGSTLTIARSMALTQPTGFRAQGPYSATTHETSFDRATLLLQQVQAGQIANVTGDISAATVTVTGATTAVRLADLLAVLPIPAKAFGVNCDNSDEHVKIQACVTAATQCLLPASTTCSMGSTSLSIPTGHRLVGQGMNSTTLRYAGTGCAVTIDNNDGGGMDRLKVFASNTAATVRDLCLTNVAGPTLRLSFNDVFLLGAQTPPVAGAYCLFVHSTTGNSLYYSLFSHLVTLNCDRGVELLGDAGFGGANANWFVGYSSNANVSGVYMDGLASDNYVQGHCNASGTAFGQTCVVVGDGVHIAAGNTTFMASDQGVNGQDFVINTLASGNFLFSDNESTIAGQLLGDSTNFVFASKALQVSGRNAYTPSGLFSGSNSIGNSLFVGQAFRATRQTHVANANYTMLTSDFFIGFNTLSAARTLTAVASTGQMVFVFDEDGTATGANTITFAAPAGGTVNGSATKVIINAASASALCYASSSDGKTWLCR